MPREKKNKICSNEYEHEHWAKDRLILGIDEAGRGPLAGPLTVAGVVFPIGYENPEIYDSKALSEKKRERLFEVIKQDALWHKIVNVPPADIDRLALAAVTRAAAGADRLFLGGH